MTTLPQVNLKQTSPEAKVHTHFNVHTFFASALLNQDWA